MMVQKRWPSDQANHIVAFLASADIKVFGCTYLPIYNAAYDWSRTFFTPRMFLFSISLLIGSINRCYYLYVTLCMRGSKRKFVLQKSCSTQHIPPGVLQHLWCATVYTTSHRNTHNYATTVNGML